MNRSASRSEPRLLVPSLLFIALVVAAVGSLGAPLITSVATTFHVSLASAQWTLTITLLSGAIATPVLGRLGAGPHRRGTILATLAVVVAGIGLAVLPLPFAWLLVGRAAQGVGLGLTALMMSVARDHLSEERGTSPSPRLWNRHVGLAVSMAAVAALLLCVWTAYERRVTSPLVDIRLARHRSVAVANVVTLVGGVGMYLLLALMTRYAQTPRAAGYGFGLTTFVAGLVLVPFSLLGFLGGKLTVRLRERIGAPMSLAGSAIVVLGAFVLFALARSYVAELLVAMAILGLGVGSFSAAMPAVILAVNPQSETSSAMSFNQVVRSVGFSLGSAVGGLILAAGTDTGRVFPADAAYTTAAWIGVAVVAAAAMTSVVLAGARSAGADQRPLAVSTHPGLGHHVTPEVSHFVDGR